MVRDLVIMGAGGHGGELLDVVEINELAPTWRFLGFLADRDDRAARVAAVVADVSPPVVVVGVPARPIGSSRGEGAASA